MGVFCALTVKFLVQVIIGAYPSKLNPCASQLPVRMAAGDISLPSSDKQVKVNFIITLHYNLHHAAFGLTIYGFDAHLLNNPCKLRGTYMFAAAKKVTGNKYFFRQANYSISFTWYSWRRKLPAMFIRSRWGVSSSSRRSAKRFALA